MKKTRSAVSLVVVSILFFAVTIPAHASSQFDEGVVANQQLPSFIPDGAVAMTEAEMSEVRGEVLPAIVVAYLGVIYYYGVVYGIPFATNYAANLSGGTWILKQTVKEKVKQYFGW